MAIPPPSFATPGRIAVPSLLPGTAPRPMMGAASSPTTFTATPAARPGGVFGGGGARDDSKPANPNELHGTPDGQPVRLASGLIVQPMAVNGQRVSRAELMDAIRGVSLLPAADVASIARAGVKLHLLPVAVLEDNLLGATTILRKNSSQPWQPTLVRVAVRARLGGEESTQEIVQHELGHVLSVLRTQDTSEEAAERYAQRY